MRAVRAVTSLASGASVNVVLKSMSMRARDLLSLETLLESADHVHKLRKVLGHEIGLRRSHICHLCSHLYLTEDAHSSKSSGIRGTKNLLYQSRYSPS
jgi:hypothetical protein